MRWALGLLALVLVLVLASPSGGEHLSVGVSETTTAVSEDPRDPSVDEALYERGTRRDCPQPALDPEQPRRASADAMCGQLVYHEGTEFEREAPPDQRLADPIGAFDVQRTHNLGLLGLSTCQPWCNAGAVYTYAIYDGANQAAYAAGLSPSPWADEADGGHQRYGGGVQLRHAGGTLAGTGALEGDGWTLPSADRTFAGLLVDDGAHPIGPERLQAIAADSPLPADARLEVCGFSPDLQLATDGCELAFQWQGPDADDPGNPCRSRAYVCGTTGGAWHARLTCPGLDGCRTPDTPQRSHPGEVAGLPEASAGSLQDPIVWHFVVAPTRSECGGDREPGFTPAPGQPGIPYLAHDLDVYTAHDSPNTDLDSRETGFLVENAQAHLADGLQTAAEPAWREPPEEPNHGRANETVRDTSAKQAIAREWEDCRRIGHPSETRARFDPWVNVIDARLQPMASDPLVAGSLEAPTGTEGERGRTGAYVPTGRAVYAADVDDDGDREQAPWPDQFSTEGVHPVLWDMHVTDEGHPDEDEGCPILGGATGVQLRLTEAMVDAGYGARTGLVQAFALDEPVAWTHRPTGRTAPFPNGGVFVLASQAMHQLGVFGDDEAVQDHVQTLTRAAAQAAGLEDRRPIVLRQVLGLEVSGSDLQPQCGEEAGGFTSEWSITRACSGQGGCTSSIAVTRLLVETTEPARGFLDHATWARPFPAGHDEAFPRGLQTWTDVDPLATVSG